MWEEMTQESSQVIRKHKFINSFNLSSCTVFCSVIISLKDMGEEEPVVKEIKNGINSLKC